MRTHAQPLAAMPFSCLGRTCLHWRPDGELIEDDRDWVLQRLRLVDPLLEGGSDPLSGASPPLLQPPA